MTANFEKAEPQFENPDASKLEDKTNEDGSPRKQVDRIAEKLAEKSSKVEQASDQAKPIFTK